MMCSHWASLLETERAKPYFHQLTQFVAHKRSVEPVFPAEDDVFRAFELTPFDQLRVVILGQDPYHQAGQAHGLSFSVNHGVKIPPSLVNIFKQLKSEDPHFVTPEHGNLCAWAKQGVLLLNTVLTVSEGQANSHKKQGWESFTDAVLSYISINTQDCVFMLWGAQAQKKASLIDGKKHRILNAPHPSPLSAHRGFLGCNHFSLANAHLQNCGKSPVRW